MYQHFYNNIIVCTLIALLLVPFGRIHPMQYSHNTSTAYTHHSSTIVPTSDTNTTSPAFQSSRLTRPDSVAMAANAEAKRSIESLVEYLQQHLKTEEQLIRAIYTWVSTNIEYTVYEYYISDKDKRNERKHTLKAWLSRKGTCQEYALIFKALAEEAGMDAHIITGYNKVDGALQPNLHDWCAVKVEGKWCLFDPTWGAGSVKDMKFVPSLNYKYYNPHADTLLKTHMPIDPIFQLRKRPLTYDEFDTGTFDKERTVPICSWEDSLAMYMKQDKLQKITGLKQRILANGQLNSLVDYALGVTSNNINVAIEQNFIDAYNTSIELQNQAADKINEFIRYRNGAFEPLKEEAEIRKMVETPRLLIDKADKLINSLTAIPEKHNKKVQELKYFIQDIAATIRKHELFLVEYFKLPVKHRKNAFKAG